MTDQVRRRNGQPFTWIDNKILNDYGARMGANGLAVWMCLSQMADNKTGESFPALKTIAKKIGFKTTSPVRAAIKNLVELGLLIVEPRMRADGSRTSNLYILLDPPNEEDVQDEKETPAPCTDIPLGGYTRRGENNYTQELDLPNNLDSQGESPPTADADCPGGQSLGESAPRRKRTMTAWEKTRHELAEEFTRVTGIKMPTRGQGIYKHRQAIWWGPLKTIYDVAGEEVPRAKQLIAQAVAYNKKEGLSVVSPGSIEKIVIAQAAEIPQKGSMQAW